MASQCFYPPSGLLPKDQSLRSATASRVINACAVRTNTLEAKSALIDQVIDSSNVLFYGADPTGVADSTAAFSAALASENCDIYVPGGTYLVTETLTVPATKTLFGACPRSSLIQFDNDTANYDALILPANTTLKDLSLTYAGANQTTSTMVSVTGGNVNLENVYMDTSDTQTAWGVAFEAVAADATITNSRIHGVLIGVRFTAAYTNVRITGGHINGGTAGTAVNTTTAGTPTQIIGNRITANGGASTGINAATAVTAVANVYSVTTPLTGAGLATSTIMESLTVDNSINTTGRVSIDGVPVLNNQIAGWTTTTGASTPARTLSTGDNTVTELTNALKQLIADLDQHGLISATITP